MFNVDPESQPLSESSEMGEEAADGTGTTPPTQQPAQDMNQVTQMMGRLITAQQQQQEAMLKLVADREASSSSTPAPRQCAVSAPGCHGSRSSLFSKFSNNQFCISTNT